MARLTRESPTTGDILESHRLKQEQDLERLKQELEKSLEQLTSKLGVDLNADIEELKQFGFTNIQVSPQGQIESVTMRHGREPLTRDQLTPYELAGLKKLIACEEEKQKIKGEIEITPEQNAILKDVKDALTELRKTSKSFWVLLLKNRIENAAILGVPENNPVIVEASAELPELEKKAILKDVKDALTELRKTSKSLWVYLLKSKIEGAIELGVPETHPTIVEARAELLKIGKRKFKYFHKKVDGSAIIVEFDQYGRHFSYPQSTNTFESGSFASRFEPYLSTQEEIEAFELAFTESQNTQS